MSLDTTVYLVYFFPVSDQSQMVLTNGDISHTKMSILKRLCRNVYKLLGKK